LALVGGRNPSEGGYNRAVQARRSPGSAFKLFVYAAATEAGLDEYDHFTDSRATYVGRNGKPYSPRNYDGRYLGSISLMTAFAKSKNTIAVKVANEIGIDKVIDVAKRMGIPARYMQPNLSLALGAVGVSPLEMAAAYAVVANDGKYLAPTPILEIRDSDGNLLFQHVPKPTQVISEEVALQMQRYTRRVVTSGTATSIYARVPNASGKTGTTNDDRDAWFCGFVGHFACAVWVGNDDYSPMEHVYGGKVCAPIWADVAQKCQKRYAGQNLAEKLQQTARAETSHPDSSTSQDTGASSQSPLAPTDEDDLVTVMICPESGRLASEYCPNPEVKVMPAARAPSVVCSKHGPGN
jgi:membrane peptidoglycan carboxypeptidase